MFAVTGLFCKSCLVFCPQMTQIITDFFAENVGTVGAVLKTVPSGWAQIILKQQGSVPVDTPLLFLYKASCD
jgi:hypothetical protein